MVSRQAQKVIKDLFRNKAVSMQHTEENFAEAMMKARKTADETLGMQETDRRIREICTVAEDNVRGDRFIYDPDDPQKRNHVLLFIHGGAFCNGTVFSRRFLCAKLCAAGKMDGFAVDYGQWPQVMHPQGMLDVIQAYKWLRKRYAADQIHIFGESAGANLAVAAVLYLRDHEEALPESVCVNSPPVIIGTAEKVLKALPSHVTRWKREPMIVEDFDHLLLPYFRPEDSEDCYASIAFADYQGFPRLMVVCGTEEILYDDARLLAEKAEQAGVTVACKEYPEMFHVFGMYDIPETDILAEDVATFFFPEGRE